MKVALSGLGGDEMFAGYSGFRSVGCMELLGNVWKHVPDSFHSPLAGMFAAFAPSSDQNRNLTALGRDERRIVHPYFLSRMLFTPEQIHDLLPEMNKDSAALQRSEKPLQESFNRAQSLDPVNRVSYLEARCYMLNTLLRDSEFMSMTHGLEVPVPLIVHHLARRGMALPGSWK